MNNNRQNCQIPFHTLKPSHLILEIFFLNKLSNKENAYHLTDLSSDLTFWVKPQQKQKAEAKACRGLFAVCVNVGATLTLAALL